GGGPGGFVVAPDKLGVNVEEGAAHVLGEGEVGRPVARIVLVVENAADAPWFVPVLQPEVVVAPLLVPAVVDAVVLAGGAVGGMEVDGVDVGLRATPVEHGRQIAAATEPPVAGDDHAGIHVGGRN